MGADEVGPECKIIIFSAPNQIRELRAHCSDSINVEGQDDDILKSCARDVRRKSL